MAKCNVCFRKCDIEEGGTGFCKVRGNKDGEIISLNYGKVTSLALDPIEKKPLNRFMPGSRILSVGSYGCNLRCPFCQNSDISWSDKAYEYGKRAEDITPKELADIAYSCRDRGNVGVAFTYNEPLIGYEFVLDTAKIVHDMGMVNVLVTNGTASTEILEKLLPYIDAMNIDLKSFSEDYYGNVLGGSLPMVKEFITEAAKNCHVELTTLIVPGDNDCADEMREISSFIAGLKDKDENIIGGNVPLHISRFFPRFKMTDREPTDVNLIYSLADIAREKLKYVYEGNV